MTPTETYRRLRELYPDKKVINLCSKDHALLCSLWDEATNKVIALRECIENYGFTYVKESENDIFLTCELYKRYPNNIVDLGSLEDLELKNKLKNRARNSKLSVHKYLSSIGFSIQSNESDKASKEKIDITLKRLYPEKVVTSSSLKENGLYSRLKQLADRKKIGLKKLLESMGLQYIEEPKTETKPKVIQDLEELYPNRIVKNLITTNPALYKRVSVKSSEKGFSIRGYLKSYGFQYISSIPTKKRKRYQR